MIHLRSLSLKRRSADDGASFPFSLPAIRELGELTFDSPVTFFVGENGSGKSTVLESIAVATGLPNVGSTSVELDESLRAQRELGARLRLRWEKRTHRGFFLRAEDFFGFTRQLTRMRQEMVARLSEIDVEYADRSPMAKSLARMPAATSLAEMEARYGIDLHTNSHGQSFLTLFQSRFVPGGLFLLDEPEAPLSPQSQLAFIAMLRSMIDEDAQFIIATHSPIILAFPGATIYSFDELPVRQVPFAELEHVNLTRDFLMNPERYLRQL